jgi:hypothetical protein
MAKKKDKVSTEVIECQRWSNHWRLVTFENDDGEVCVATEVELKK